MRYVQSGLVTLLALCIVLRVGADLVAPLIPALVVLLVAVSFVQYALLGRQRR